MAKFASDAFIDGALNILKDTGKTLTVCSAEPSNMTDATTTAGVMLAILAGDLTTAEFTGPVNGDVSGRKLTVDAATGLTVEATGVASHVAISDTSTELIYVTTNSTQVLGSTANTVNVGAWDIEILDPT